MTFCASVTRRTVRALAVGLLFVACLGRMAQADTITVFAAASLKTALDQVTQQFESLSGHRVSTSYAGSSALARQIQLGAPADVFLSANVKWMDVLEADGMLIPDSRVDLLFNTLVLVGVEDAPIALEAEVLRDALTAGPLAMGLVDSVPVGLYGKAALVTLGLWDAVSPRVAQVDNTRAALALVALGEAPLGVVYATDAIAEPRVFVRAEFPENSHPPIIYPAALTNGARPAAQAFLAFVQSSEARSVFEANGFGMVDP